MPGIEGKGPVPTEPDRTCTVCDRGRYSIDGADCIKPLKQDSLPGRGDGVATIEVVQRQFIVVPQPVQPIFG